jgi:hypothetical protein
MTPRKRRAYTHIRGVRLRRYGGITRTQRSHRPYSAGLRLKRDASRSARVMQLHLEIMFFRYIEPCSPVLTKNVPAGDDWQH